MGSWGQQFSSGDQGASRHAFWESDYKICPSCKSSNISSETHVAGCRHNGDGYGTEVYTCKKCSWSTSFQYDEASDGPYFYETRSWKTKDQPPSPPRKPTPNPPKPQPPPLSPGDVRGWGIEKISARLKQEGMPPEFIKKFEAEEVDGEVMMREPPCLTRAFMTKHKKWKLSDQQVDQYAPVHKKITGKELITGAWDSPF